MRMSISIARVALILICSASISCAKNSEQITTASKRIIVESVRDISKGSSITGKDVVERLVTREIIHTEGAERSLNSVVGKTANYKIHKGQTVSSYDLGADPEMLARLVCAVEVIPKGAKIAPRQIQVCWSVVKFVPKDALQEASDAVGHSTVYEILPNSVVCKSSISN